jgi:hypothetical protein
MLGNTYISGHYFVGLNFRRFNSVYYTCNYLSFHSFLSLLCCPSLERVYFFSTIPYIAHIFPLFLSGLMPFSLLLYYITAYDMYMCILYIDIFIAYYISPPSASLASSVDLLQLFHLCAVKKNVSLVKKSPERMTHLNLLQ